MKILSRRDVIKVVSGVAAGLLFNRASRGVLHSKPGRSFTKDLNPGAIGVTGSLPEIVALAAEHGFESVAPNSGYLSTHNAVELQSLASGMKESGIVWGAAGLPVEFRRDDAKFRSDLKQLPTHAKALQSAGVTRVGTWLMPCHAELTYVQNFRQHAARLRECVKVLGDHGLRFGMEYVGPRTLWASKRHSFIHTMTETKDLIAEIGRPNVGFVLDSWHWYTAHETIDDLLSLTNDDVIACDLNDAPKGLEIDKQIDFQRELPAATGVIDLKAFLSALVQIGYDGPVRSEPFNAPLNAMDNAAACKAASRAMDTAFRLIKG